MAFIFGPLVFDRTLPDTEVPAKLFHATSSYLLSSASRLSSSINLAQTDAMSLNGLSTKDGSSAASSQFQLYQSTGSTLLPALLSHKSNITISSSDALGTHSDIKAEIALSPSSPQLSNSIRRLSMQLTSPISQDTATNVATQRRFTMSGSVPKQLAPKITSIADGKGKSNANIFASPSAGLAIASNVRLNGDGSSCGSFDSAGHQSRALFERRTDLAKFLFCQEPVTLCQAGAVLELMIRDFETIFEKTVCQLAGNRTSSEYMSRLNVTL